MNKVRTLALIAVTVLLNLAGTAPAAAANSAWLPMPMVSQNALNAGVWPGGEGCQFPQMIALDSQDGDFILYGTDVGGMYRSTNGERAFQPCNVGVETAGVVGLAIDPRNSARCLEVGDGDGNAFNIFGGVISRPTGELLGRARVPNGSTR